jgi:hypothetical protein
VSRKEVDKMQKGKARKKEVSIPAINVGFISKALGMLSNQLVALAEDEVKWNIVCEKIRQELLLRLNPKKVKQIQDRRKK